MIDSSRHFISFHILQRNLFAMASVKLNCCHLHLTDDQGINSIIVKIIMNIFFPQRNKVSIKIISGINRKGIRREILYTRTIERIDRTSRYAWNKVFFQFFFNIFFLNFLFKKSDTRNWCTFSYNPIFCKSSWVEFKAKRIQNWNRVKNFFFFNFFFNFFFIFIHKTKLWNILSCFWSY